MSGGVNLNGQNIAMGADPGAAGGGGTLWMAGGTIAFDNGASTQISASGGTLNIEATGDISLHTALGSNLNMVDGGGSGAGDLHMDSGQIVQMRAENAAAAPASPAAGQIYHNTTDHHFYGWNGSVWKHLDN